MLSMTLTYGLYAFEKRILNELAQPKEHRSILAFLRALRRREPLADEVLVTGLDRMLYQVFWLNGGEAEDKAEKALKVVEGVVKMFGSELYRHRADLARRASVVLFPLEYVEHSTYWKAGIRYRPTGEPLELFRLEWFFPRCEVMEIAGEPACYSMF